MPEGGWEEVGWEIVGGEGCQGEWERLSRCMGEAVKAENYVKHDSWTVFMLRLFLHDSY